MNTYTVSRIWDDGAEWPDVPDGEYSTERAARNAALEYIRDHADDGEYGQADGETTVRVSYAIADDDGDEIGTGYADADLVVDELAMIRAAGGDPDCDHDWSREGEGGCDENPGVWSLGGTTHMVREHCTHCEIVRETITRGPQRNPGESDTVRYSLGDQR